MFTKNYEEFVEKFKPKKTSDDCYTPDNIYNAVADFVSEKYNVDKSSFCRPFYPGGDYEHYDYNGKIVVDNPPFSILAKISNFYSDNNIKFFLFAPSLTLFYGFKNKITYIPCNINIVYENGAKIGTSFITNMDNSDFIICTYPELVKKVNEEVSKNIEKAKKQLTKYKYPPNLITAARISYLSKYAEIKINRKSVFRVRELDAQKPLKKAIFGSGFLISDNCLKMVEKAEKEKAEKEKAEKEKAEKEKAEKALVIELSDRERDIIKNLNNC